MHFNRSISRKAAIAGTHIYFIRTITIRIGGIFKILARLEAQCPRRRIDTEQARIIAPIDRIGQGITLIIRGCDGASRRLIFVGIDIDRVIPYRSRHSSTCQTLQVSYRGTTSFIQAPCRNQSRCGNVHPIKHN